jgi:serine phosphatase RsbU (regulator of sigma subunit)
MSAHFPKFAQGYGSQEICYMNHYLKKLSCLFILVLFLTLSSYSQKVPEAWLKSEFILVLTSYISWPNEAELDTFRIGILGADKVYSMLGMKADLDTLKNKPVSVEHYRRTRDVRPVQVLFVGDERQTVLKQVFRRFKDQPVLIITDSAANYDYTMLNLLSKSMVGKPFEVNKANIENAGLTLSYEILYVGGREDDLRLVVQESIRQRDELAGNLDSLQNELTERQEELTETSLKLENRTAEIGHLNQAVDQQTEQLMNLSNDVDLKQMDLEEKIQLLGSREARIQEKELEIIDLNDSISKKEKMYQAQDRYLIERYKITVEQELLIEEQEDRINLQSQLIEQQKLLLVFFVILSLLIITMIFFIYRAYRVKKRANRIYREKNSIIQDQNKAISSQKEEIEAQRDQLQDINRKIERQNENIRASISYGLTIQQAILPDLRLREIERMFESFVLYYPKDIVSGDFYWFSNLGRNRAGDETIFIAAVDCTGHGVPGAFLSMIGSRMLSAIVNESKVRETDTILELMNKRLRHALNQPRSENNDGMDICLCKIIRKDVRKQADQPVYLSFSGAKRSLFLKREGREVEIIKGDRRTTGGGHFNPNPFSKNELSLQKEDKIYLTTDGLMDQHSPSREKFRSKRFVEFLNQYGNLPMLEQQTRLEEQLHVYMADGNQTDDITVMGLKL